MANRSPSDNDAAGSKGLQESPFHVIIAGVGSVGRIVKSTEHGLHGQT